MARISKLQLWLDAGNTSSDFLSRWNFDSVSREILWREVGYENEGAAYNAARNAGIIAGGPVGNGDGEKKPRASKCGVLPVKVALAVCKAIGIDTDDFETVDYTLYCQALGEQGDAWRDFLYTRLGGIESPAGQTFKAWCDWHIALDAAKAAEEARQADPAYKVKVQLDGAKREIAALKVTLESAQSRVAELEAELRISRIGSRRTNGGNLTSAMKRLMIQRFHPDKQNGNDTELYTAVMQYVNGMETVD